MTDRNVDRRVFLPLYQELFTKNMELLWMAEEQAKTNLLFGGQSLESETEQTRKMATAVQPAKAAAARMLQLLLTPDTHEMNSYCIDNNMQGDVYLLGGYETALGGTYDEVRAAAAEYGQKILDRLSFLYLTADGEETDGTVFGENETFDLGADA